MRALRILADMVKRNYLNDFGVRLEDDSVVLSSTVNNDQLHIIGKFKEETLTHYFPYLDPRGDPATTHLYYAGQQYVEIIAHEGKIQGKLPNKTPQVCRTLEHTLFSMMEHLQGRDTRVWQNETWHEQVFYSRGKCLSEDGLKIKFDREGPSIREYLNFVDTHLPKKKRRQHLAKVNNHVYIKHYGHIRSSHAFLIKVDHEENIRETSDLNVLLGQLASLKREVSVLIEKRSEGYCSGSVLFRQGANGALQYIEKKGDISPAFLAPFPEKSLQDLVKEYRSSAQETTSTTLGVCEFPSPVFLSYGSDNKVKKKQGASLRF